MSWLGRLAVESEEAHAAPWIGLPIGGQDVLGHKTPVDADLQPPPRF